MPTSVLSLFYTHQYTLSACQPPTRPINVCWPKLAADCSHYVELILYAGYSLALKEAAKLVEEAVDVTND